MNAMFEKRKGEDIVRSNIVPQTNADRIRNMTDEELAEFIASVSDHCLAGIGEVDCSNMQNCDGCKNVTLQWLKSEVKE